MASVTSHVVSGIIAFCVFLGNFFSNPSTGYIPPLFYSIATLFFSVGVFCLLEKILKAIEGER